MNENMVILLMRGISDGRLKGLIGFVWGWECNKHRLGLE